MRGGTANVAGLVSEPREGVAEDYLTRRFRVTLAPETFRRAWRVNSASNRVISFCFLWRRLFGGAAFGGAASRRGQKSNAAGSRFTSSDVVVCTPSANRAVRVARARPQRRAPIG